ncbi:MAG: response regulator [Gemmatimonadota bacterium]
MRTDLPRSSETFSATLAALHGAAAELAMHGSAALGTIHRVAGRIKDASAALGLEAAYATADGILHAETADEIRALVARLTEQLNETSDPGREFPVTILVVEDDEPIGQVIGLTLAGPNRTVLVVESAAEAERELASREVSLLMLDLSLPDGDGRDLLIQVRGTDNSRHIPIVVATAYADRTTHAECFALGADSVLTKPIDPMVLESVVAAKLEAAANARRDRGEDALTGLPNRAAFFEALGRARAAGSAEGKPLSVAIIDLDHFKHVNDRHGHTAGDAVLQASARRIRGALRISDFVARYGGEEFCAFFSNTDVSGAVIALQTVLAQLRAERFSGNDGVTFGITFSAGVAPIHDDVTPEQALAEADRLLYLAKAAGRNRVCSAIEASNLPRPAALLVEDDDAVAAVVSALLDRDGLDVSRYAEAKPALSAMEQRAFSIAIVDLGLPDMSGLELLACIRRLPRIKPLPVLMLTGSGAENDIVDAFALGVNDYVTKPFLARELRARVCRLIA